MKLTTTFASSLILMFGSLSPSAAQTAVTGFISGEVKTTYKEIVVDGKIVTQASRSTVKTDSRGNITSREQTEIIVSDGAGGFTKVETRYTTRATLDPAGTYTVNTTTVVFTTALNADKGRILGEDPVEGDPIDSGRYDVPRNSLNLPLEGTMQTGSAFDGQIYISKA